MLRRGTIAVLAGSATLLGTGMAFADQQVTASFRNHYDSTTITMAQGEPLTFKNNDIVIHDVSSTTPGDVNGHLFASDTIGNGESSFVEGSQYLTAGSYQFFCSVHPDEMKGTLVVTNEGTPKPRPGTGSAPPPDTTPPTLTLAAHSAKASKLKKGGSLKVDLGADEAAKLVLTVKVGSTSAARVKVDLGSAGTRKLAFKLSKRARAKLKKGTTLKLSLTGTDSAGNKGSAAAKLKLS